MEYIGVGSYQRHIDIYCARSINELIDEIQRAYESLSAECRNAIHAARPYHPLGNGLNRPELFYNAGFVLEARVGKTPHVEWLYKLSELYSK